MVNNADIIAIIKITGAPNRGPTSKFSTAKTAQAEIVESFVGDLPGIIKIKNSPHFKAQGAMFDISMLRKGKYFAFLKRLESNVDIYVPLTGSSLHSIFDDKIQPTWKIDEMNNSGNGLKLIDVVNNIRSIHRVGDL